MQSLKIQNIYQQDKYYLREGEFTEIENFNTLQDDVSWGIRGDHWLIPDSLEEQMRERYYNDTLEISANPNTKVGYFEVDDVLYVQMVNPESEEIVGGARFLESEKFQGSFNGSEIEQVFPDNSQGAKAAALEIDNQIMLSAAKQQATFITPQPMHHQAESLVNHAVEIIACNKGDIFCADVETIKDLQRGMTAAGFDLGPNPESGNVDSYTQQAIVDFTIEFSDEISQYKTTDQPQRQR